MQRRHIYFAQVSVAILFSVRFFLSHLLNVVIIELNRQSWLNCLAGFERGTLYGLSKQNICNDRLTMQSTANEFVLFFHAIPKRMGTLETAREIEIYAWNCCRANPNPICLALMTIIVWLSPHCNFPIYRTQAGKRVRKKWENIDFAQINLRFR